MLLSISSGNVLAKALNHSRHLRATLPVECIAVAYFSARTATKSSAVPEASRKPSFKQLGIPLELLDLVEHAFPHVVSPTPSQTALIRAVKPTRNGPSVIMRDVTGSGKSLALLLALLSNPDLSRPFHKAKTRKLVKATRKKAFPEQILLVPHTELAKQFEGWIDRLRTPQTESPAHAESESGNQEAAGSIEATSSTESASPKILPALRHTQVLYRGSTDELDISTRFLIATPSYLVDVLNKISTSHLHTIALDEADEMLKLPARFHTHKDEAKWHRHPPLLLTIMDDLLSSPQAASASTTKPTKKRIVAVSASANSVFRDYLVRRSGWLNAGPPETSDATKEANRAVDWYDFSSEPFALKSDAPDVPEEELSELQRIGRARMPQADIKHYVARVNKLGDVVSEKTLNEDVQSTQATEVPLDPNRFLVATAYLFALEQVHRGLLLIPSTQSSQSTLDFLKDLAVPAVPLSKAFDASVPSDEPVLYVASVDSIRGVDIPQLEWLFLLPNTRVHNDAKDYMHVAGRVGRLVDSEGGRGSGTVVSLVDHNDEKQCRKIMNIWELLGLDGEALQLEDIETPSEEAAV